MKKKKEEQPKTILRKITMKLKNDVDLEKGDIEFRMHQNKVEVED